MSGYAQIHATLDSDKEITINTYGDPEDVEELKKQLMKILNESEGIEIATKNQKISGDEASQGLSMEKGGEE